MKTTSYYTFLFCAFFVLMSACKNNNSAPPQPPQPHGDYLPSSPGPKILDTVEAIKYPTPSTSSNIEIVVDEKGKMMWGTTQIKGAEDFRKKLTAELKKRDKQGAERPGLGVSGYLSDASNELYKVYDEVLASLYGGGSEKKAKPNTTSALKPITVQIAKGKFDTYLTKTINPTSSMDFNMYAKKGQTISFTIGYDFKDSDIEGFLTEPTLQDISLTTGPKSPNEFKVKITGNHRLTVHNTTKKKITMTLYVRIQ
jgi:hypothetical protein